MAGAGAKKFPAFSKLASDDVNNYLADQVIMRFATTTARDAAFGGVGEPTLAEGMTAYIDADNSIYTYDGSNWVKMVSASTPPALQLIRSETFPLTNNLIIDDIFSSAFVDYRVILEVNNISAAVAIQMQLRSGTTNLGTSGYYAAGVLAVTGTSSISFIGENNSPQFLATVPYTTGNYAFCDMDIYRPNETQYTMIASKNMNFRDSPSIMESRFMNGSYQQTTAATGMRFFTTGATFAGRYVVYGYRAS